MLGYVGPVDRLETFVAAEVLDVEGEHPIEAMHERRGGEAGVEELAAHHAVLTEQRAPLRVDCRRLEERVEVSLEPRHKGVGPRVGEAEAVACDRPGADEPKLSEILGKDAKAMIVL